MDGGSVSNSDPFGIEKAKGTSLRLPKTAGKGQQYARRAVRGAKTKIHNATGKGATNLDSPTGTSFGEYSADQKSVRRDDRVRSTKAGYLTGLVGGVTAGAMINGAQTSRDRRVVHQREFAKARVARITSLGTKASKNKRWPRLHPGAVAGGAVVGGALGYGASAIGRKTARKDVDTLYRRQERAKAKASAIAKRKKPELERYTPDRTERAKMRAKRSAAYTAGGAGAVLGAKALERAQLPKPYRKLRPYKAKPALIVGGIGAAIGASGKLDKEQYRVKKNDPFGISKKENKAKGAAIAAGGAGTLGGTAMLPRVEHAIVRHKTGKIDAKIANLNASKPAKTPSKNVNGQMMRTTSPKEKIARGVKLKEITGKVDELNRAKKAIKRPHLAGNAKATWAGIAVGAPAIWYGSRHSVSKKETGHRRDVDAGLVGGAAGAGAYQEASYALKPFDRRAEAKIKNNPDLNRRARAYQKQSGRPKNAKAGDPAWHSYHRNYPKDLPGGRLKRTLAVTHTGKTGGALTVAAGGAAAIGAAVADRKFLRKPKSAVAKFDQKPPPTNKRIARQKQAQAKFSLAGGTLGLAALGTRGKASALTRAAKTSANGPKLLSAAQKWKDRSTGLTTVGAGIGGVGAYNFASYTSAEAKAQAKKKGPVAKMDDPFGISKLGSPKVKYQELTAYTQRGNTTTKHDADTIENHYKGKSLLLRRPKYQAVGHPSKIEGKLKHGDYVSATPNYRANKKAAVALHQAHQKKAKSVDLGEGKIKHVAKRDPFNVEKKQGSGGRDVAAAVVPGWHGAVAGKKGKKLRAFGNETAGALLGGAAGNIIGGPVGAGVGTMVGGFAGGRRNQQKGHLKPIKKNYTESAFGIVHE